MDWLGWPSALCHMKLLKCAVIEEGNYLMKPKGLVSQWIFVQIDFIPFVGKSRGLLARIVGLENLEACCLFISCLLST